MISNYNSGIVVNNIKQNQRKRFKRFLNSFPLTLMATPTIIYFLIFKYLPLYGLLLPFKNYKISLGFFKSEWCGLKNFGFLINNDQLNIAIRNTILYNIVFIVFGIILSVSIALMLYEISGLKVKVYQTTLFLPFYISWVVVAYALIAFLDMDYGLINKLLVSFNMQPVLWYNNPLYWPTILVISELWKGCGAGAVIYYATLMGIDKSLFEAAKIDGANKWQLIKNISIPSIKYIIIVMTILKIGKIFYGDFGLFYSLTLNSPLLYSTTDIIDTYVYRALIGSGDIGISSAVGFVQSVMGFILVVTTNFIVKKIDEDSALF